MTADLVPKIRAYIAELEELLRQLHAGEAGTETALDVERVEQALNLFREMLNKIEVSDR